jgi:hypothetical protein
VRRADRRTRPIRPTVILARDSRRISARPLQVIGNLGTPCADLGSLASAIPEVNPLIGGLLSVALELTLMLPRPMLERIVLRLIDRLDELDGDSDLEALDDREPELEM